MGGHGTAGRGARLGGAAVLALAGLLTGCSGAEAGSAATVGNTAISESSLQSRVNDFLASLPASDRASQQGNLAQVQTAVLSAMVDEEVVGQVAGERGIAVTPAQVATKVAADVQGSGADLDSQLANLYLTRDALSAFEQTNLEFVAIGVTLGTKGLTAQQIQAKTLAYIKQEAVKLPVRVSPRYGVWDPSQLSLSGGTQSISTPGPTPTATPAA